MNLDLVNEALSGAPRLALAGGPSLIEPVLAYCSHVLGVSPEVRALVAGPEGSFGLEPLAPAEAAAYLAVGSREALEGAGLPESTRTLALSDRDLARLRELYSDWFFRMWETAPPQSMVLYGAGVAGKTLLELLEYIGRRAAVACVAVTNPQETRVMGVPLVAADQLAARLGPQWEETPVVLATYPPLHREIAQELTRRGYRNLHPLFEECLVRFWDACGRVAARHWAQACNSGLLADTPYLVRQDEAYNPIYHIALREDAHRPLALVPHFRFFQQEGQEKHCPALFARDLLADYQEQYGPYRLLKTQAKAEVPPGTQIPPVFMFCNQQDVATRPTNRRREYLLPLQTGAAAADHIFAPYHDAAGDNLSDRNRKYAEMSGVYWVWKNFPPAPYVGVCHYRRHFLLEEEDLLQIAAQDLDMVVQTPCLLIPDNGLRFVVAGYITRKHLAFCRQAIQEICPEYLPAYREAVGCRMIHACNMFVMKWAWFDRYCSWLFPILFRAEALSVEENLDRDWGKYLAYLAELLLDPFIAYHKNELKVALADWQALL